MDYLTLDKEQLIKLLQSDNKELAYRKAAVLNNIKIKSQEMVVLIKEFNTILKEE